MKTRHYIAALTLLAALVSCSRESIETATTPDGFVEVTIPVYFTSPVLVPTRAQWAEGPTADAFKLYLCVYGSGKGLVQNWIPAKVLSLNSVGGYVTSGEYKAMLPLADEERTIHLYVNPPASVNPTLTDYIDNVMEKMVDEGGECTYWQEVVLDEITEDPASTAKLTAGVHVVRNFAKIIVETADDQPFEVLQWALLNTPDKGYVAPYNPNNKHIHGAPADAGERFPSGYLNDNIVALANATDGSLFTQLSGTGDGQDNYPGYMPKDATLVGDVARTEDEFNEYPGAPGEGNTNYVLAGAPRYMYERPVPSTSERPTAVLVQIQFDEGAEPAADADQLTEDRTYWYKIEVLDNEGSYVPFYRGIVYRMNIADIEEVGEKTPLDAFQGGYFGNISASVETASLTDLSNKTSQIHVDLLDYTYVSVPDDGWVTLMNSETEASQFWFIPDLEAGTAYPKSEDGVCQITVSQVAVAGHDASVAEFRANDDGSIEVKLTAQDPNQVKKSIIRVAGKALPGGQEIYRDITINLMSKPEFKNVEVVNDETVVHNSTVTASEGTNGPGKEVVVTVWLPKDLGPSLFPIQVCFEAENNTLSATSPDLPVKTGPSKFAPTRNTFYYIRTIKYSEYCWLNTNKKYVYNYEFPCTFYTTGEGDNSTRIIVYDKNDRFIPIEYLNL